MSMTFKIQFQENQEKLAIVCHPSYCARGGAKEHFHFRTYVQYTPPSPLSCLEYCCASRVAIQLPLQRLLLATAPSLCHPRCARGSATDLNLLIFCVFDARHVKPSPKFSNIVQYPHMYQDITDITT